MNISFAIFLTGGIARVGLTGCEGREQAATETLEKSKQQAAKTLEDTLAPSLVQRE